MLLWNTPPEWWQYIGMLAGLIVSLSMGYGDKKPYWYKAIVGTLYGTSLLFIGFNVWVPLIPVLFILMFIASNKIQFLRSVFVWKIVEFVAGCSIGVACAFFVQESEWLMIACMGTGGILFAAGGTHINKIGGQKWLRRYLMPVLLTLYMFIGLN